MEFMENPPKGRAEIDSDHLVMLIESVSPVSIATIGALDLVSGLVGEGAFDELQEDLLAISESVGSHVASSLCHVNMDAWVNIALENGWTQVGGKRTAGYRILATNLVIFKGRISGTNSTSPVFFTLPVGCRPGSTVDMVAWGDGSPALLNIASSGAVSCAVSHIGALSLENIFFSV